MKGVFTQPLATRELSFTQPTLVIAVTFGALNPIMFVAAETIESQCRFRSNSIKKELESQAGGSITLTFNVGSITGGAVENQSARHPGNSRTASDLKCMVKQPELATIVAGNVAFRFPEYCPNLGEAILGPLKKVIVSRAGSVWKEVKV